MKEREKAEQALFNKLNQPGHKDEKKAFHAARRGESVRGSKIIETKKQKAMSRAALNRAARVW